MAQWINVLQNNNFINLMGLPLLCRNSGAIHLVQPHLVTGWLAGRQNMSKFQFFKIRLKYKLITVTIKRKDGQVQLRQK